MVKGGIVMQIKSIKETTKPNYPTNKERKNSFIKFLFEHKKISLSLALALLLNSQKIVLATFPVNIPSLSVDTVVMGEQPTKILGIAQWSCYALAIGFLITAIHHEKKYKVLSAEEQKTYKKKHILSSILLLTSMLFFIIIGLLVGWLSCFEAELY